METDKVLEAPIHLIDRVDLWDTVKPYSLQYYPKEDFPRSNLQHSPYMTRIRNMRLCVPAASLDIEGFAVHRLQSKMQYADFSNESAIETIYCSELEDHIVKMTGAKNVRVLDYQLRRKSPSFPYFQGKLPPRPQPSLVAHVDLTPETAENIVRELYKDTAEQILRSRYQIITIWKPFRFPVHDWPLALCDATSIDRNDLIPMDIMYPNYLAENFMVCHNPNQRWYWLPDHQIDEILVFNAFDSEALSSSPCAHGAFPLPGEHGDAPARESIDARLLVMYADIKYPAPQPQSI